MSVSPSSSPPPPPPVRGRGRRLGLVGWLWRPVLVLLVTGGLGWWMLSLPSSERVAPVAPAPEVIAAAPPPAPEPRAWRPRRVVEPAPGCTPEASRRCVDGDAWWVDSCGVTTAKADECGAARCQAGACEAAGPGCGDLRPPGRCEGDKAMVCTGGRPFAVDCAASGQRCVSTDEGPACRPPSEDACDPAAEAPRCDGTTLISCVEGERRRLDCDTRGAICGRPPGGATPAACLQLHLPVPVPGCEDPCGCPTEPRDELCNGLDDDHDGYVDESGTCEPVDLVFFVIVDEHGEGSYAPEDLDLELARLQRAFARDDDFGLELRVADVVRVSEPDWLDVEGDEIDAMVRSPTISRYRPEFYVPVVLTERILLDGVPRPGVSTVPNGMCGGHRRVQTPQPLLGLVAVAKDRWPTTLAHELGHFFGLCHTHGDDPERVIPLDGARACEEACALEGDGICDTPLDPGPETCAVDGECLPVCADGSLPDTADVMSYYPVCRSGFTVQQAQLMRRTLALRRAWQPCLASDGCPCAVSDPMRVGVGERPCPEQMSCRRFRGDAPNERCTLDGTIVPGGVCRGSLDCSAGAQCIGQPDADSRCVRPCDATTPGCRCELVEGVEYPICVNDLRIEDP